jgi:diguanylate cyclase (GGDEF)-like protein
MTGLSTRNRLVLVVILSALPMLAMIVYGTVEQRFVAAEREHDDLRRLALVAARDNAHIIESARQLLVALAQLAPTVQHDAAVCQRALADLLQHTGDIYYGMGIHDRNGDLICNASPTQASVNVQDRLYFRVARDTARFSIGTYQVGRISQQPSINFGYPVIAGRELIGVAYVALQLDSFHRGVAKMPLPAGAMLAVIDGNGTILAAHAETDGGIGEKIAPAILKTVLRAKEGVFDESGAHGEARWFAFESIADNPDGSNALKVVVSIPRTVIFDESDRNLVRNLVGIGLSLLFLLVVARYGVERFFLRNIRKLLATAAQVKAGDLTARTGMRSSEDELSQIGAAFDDMGQALHERDARLRHALQDLQHDAVTDALTGLHNRRHLGEYLPREIARAARGADKLALLLLDLDHFKRVNDTFGHGAGDAVLTAIASVLKARTRAGDAVFRHGGEEFLVVLPDTEAQSALQRAETLRRAISELQLRHEGQDLGRQTASFGVAVFPLHGNREPELMRAADEALYSAKEQGRDRVVLASVPQT